MTEIEIKLEIFKAILSDNRNICDRTYYKGPKSAAHCANEVYEILTKKNN